MPLRTARLRNSCRSLETAVGDGMVVRDMKDPPGQRSTYILPGDVEKLNCRLATFAKYTQSLPLSAKKFAEAGFYYTGYRDILKCHGCGNCVHQWRRDDNPNDAIYHKPDCMLHTIPTEELNSTTANTNQPSIPPLHNATYVIALAPNVTQVTPPEDPTITSVTCNNVTNENLSTLFPLTDPINPHMANEQLRLATFSENYADSWPHGRIHTTPREISKAGFFYLGERDHVKCWYCNGGLRNWEYDDDPWTEHAKWFPNCEFVLRNKGPEFVHSIVARCPNLNRPRMTSFAEPRRHIVFNQVGEWSLPSRSTTSSFQREPPAIIDPQEERRNWDQAVETTMMTSNHVTNAQEMGFSEAEIRRAIRRNFEQKNRNIESLEELVETITLLEQEKNNYETEPKPPVTQKVAGTSTSTTGPQVLSEELQVRRLVEERKCKLCHREATSVVFVPCGHLAACLDCSKTVRTCPLCHSYVREKIRAFLS